MNDDNSNSPWPASRSNTEAAFDGTSDCVDFDLHDPTHPASSRSSLVGFLQDDASTIYSYFSTWSSNYTMSDLPGPGRLLGNLMSSAGSTFISRAVFGKSRAGLGSYAKAEANLRNMKPVWYVEKRGYDTEGESLQYTFGICEVCRFFVSFVRSTLTHVTGKLIQSRRYNLGLLQDHGLYCIIPLPSECRRDGLPETQRTDRPRYILVESTGG